MMLLAVWGVIVVVAITLSIILIRREWELDKARRKAQVNWELRDDDDAGQGRD